MADNDVLGTILISPEGVNGTMCGPDDGVEAVLAAIRAQDGFAALEDKKSYANENVFEKIRVRCRDQIINIGADVDPLQKCGTYVKPQEWNALISDPDVITIDTRNDYEVHLGTFEGSLDPKIKKFDQLVDYVEKNLDSSRDKKVAMFCTGGIRCEKSTAYLKEKGFENVYHLEGGILKYLEDIPQEESLWKGDCYVFDERITVDHALQPSKQGEHCPCCGHKLATYERLLPEYVPGQSCPKCP